MPWRARRLLPQVGADVAGDGLGDAAGALTRRFGFPGEDERFHQRLQPGRGSEAEAGAWLQPAALKESVGPQHLPVLAALRERPLGARREPKPMPTWVNDVPPPCQSFEG